MYWKDEGDDVEKLKKHIVEEMDGCVSGTQSGDIQLQFGAVLQQTR